jgi:hypothetical protein
VARKTLETEMLLMAEAEFRASQTRKKRVLLNHSENHNDEASQSLFIES